MGEKMARLMASPHGRESFPHLLHRHPQCCCDLENCRRIRRPPGKHNRRPPVGDPGRNGELPDTPTCVFTGFLQLSGVHLSFHASKVQEGLLPVKTYF